jgi:chitosanase
MLRTLELTSLFENGVLDLQYGFCQNIHDGRGYTFGFCGFTTGTGDGLLVIQRYIALAPVNNTFSKYVTTLQRLAAINSGDVSGLVGFCDAVAMVSNDSNFQAAQDFVQDQEIYEPSTVWAQQVGARFALTKAQLYDALVNHGQGLGDPFSINYIVSGANAAVGGTPLNGVDEKWWLNAFLFFRKIAILKYGFADAVGRVQVYQDLADLGNWNLDGPIYFDYDVHPDGWTVLDTDYGVVQID